MEINAFKKNLLERDEYINLFVLSHNLNINDVIVVPTYYRSLERLRIRNFDRVYEGRFDDKQVQTKIDSIPLWKVKCYASK
jgi:hypothetical protein